MQFGGEKFSKWQRDVTVFLLYSTVLKRETNLFAINFAETNACPTNDLSNQRTDLFIRDQLLFIHELVINELIIFKNLSIYNYKFLNL